MNEEFEVLDYERVVTRHTVEEFPIRAKPGAHNGSMFYWTNGLTFVDVARRVVANSKSAADESFVVFHADQKRGLADIEQFDGFELESTGKWQFSGPPIMRSAIDRNSGGMVVAVVRAEGQAKPSEVEFNYACWLKDMANHFNIWLLDFIFVTPADAYIQSEHCLWHG